MKVFPQQQKICNQISHILKLHQDSEAQIRPHFHLTGPSGSGKTYLVSELAKQAGMPMVEVNAAGITSEGLSGNSLSKALRNLRMHWNVPNIIFVDEFDKLFQRNGETTEGFRSAVQDEFLTALESPKVSVFTDYGKYEPIPVNNSLFIFAGAYGNQKITTIEELRDAGLRTEFIGRVPLVFYTDEVPIEELRKHIHEIDLFKKYIVVFPRTNKATAANWIADRMEEQAKGTPIGIRLLNSAIHQYFMRNV